MAVGSRSPFHLYAETFEFETSKWQGAASYPYVGYNGVRSIALYDMIFIEEHSAFFLIGGSDGKELSKIARFMGGAWSDGGNLNAARSVRLS